jgi:hypothetical protein
MKKSATTSVFRQIPLKYVIHRCILFLLRLNTGSRTSAFGSIFGQAKLNTVHGSILQNNMDDSSFNAWDDSIFKTTTLPKQAFGGYQYQTECKVSL